MKKFTSIVLMLASLAALAQETKIRFFGQPGFEYTNNPSLNKNSVYFRGSGFIFFVTSQINEKISVAAELNPHYDYKNGPAIEIERIYLRYYYKDQLSFKFGRMYNPLGFWNNNYNFGLVLQPTISRPLILTPLHDEGFTYTRSAGFQLEGNEMGALRFSYKLMVGNGIGQYGGTGGNSYNLSQDLSYTANLGIEPTDGLKLIVSGMYNKLKIGSVNQFGDSLAEGIHYWVGNASIAFMNPEKKFEFIAEYFANNNTYENAGTKTLHGAFIYAGYKASDKVIPYAIAEGTRFDKTDVFYTKSALKFESSLSLKPGFRYRFDSNAILKFEYELLFGETSHFSHGPRTQFAFSF
jgi:hypothetical protein